MTPITSRIYNINLRLILTSTVLVAMISISIAQDVFYVNTKALNVRERPSTQANVLETLQYGDKVTALEYYDDDWVKIRSSSHEGYVYKKFLSTQLTSQQKKEATVLICNSSRAYAYHAYQCRGLSNCKAGISRVTVSRAKDLGYRACKICY